MIAEATYFASLLPQLMERSFSIQLYLDAIAHVRQAPRESYMKDRRLNGTYPAMACYENVGLLLFFSVPICSMLLLSNHA